MRSMCNAQLRCRYISRTTLSERVWKQFVLPSRQRSSVCNTCSMNCVIWRKCDRNPIWLIIASWFTLHSVPSACGPLWIRDTFSSMLKVVPEASESRWTNTTTNWKSWRNVRIVVGVHRTQRRCSGQKDLLAWSMLTIKVLALFMGNHTHRKPLFLDVRVHMLILCSPKLTTPACIFSLFRCFSERIRKC